MTSSSEKPKKRTHLAPTARDVARIAGVSQSAVSRAFTPGASVAPATRAAIVAAARSLGYKPNPVARSLVSRRSNMIGVAMGSLENQFYPAALQALSNRLQSIGYYTLLFTTDPDGANDPLLKDVLSFGVDALVLASTHLSSDLAAQCSTAGIPVLLMNRTSRDVSVSSVTGDNTHGARCIAAFLAAGGHKRFGYIAGLENSSTDRDRYAGYSSWLLERGLGPVIKAPGHYNFQQAMEATRTLLKRKNRPDALFCANDHMAIAAHEVARAEFGLRIPQDLSIVGFDDVGAARWPTFDLTTFTQPVDAMADEVVRILQLLLGDEEAEPAHSTIAGDLVVRGSARLPLEGIVQERGRLVWRP